GKTTGEVVFTAYTVDGKDRPVTFALNAQACTTCTVSTCDDLVVTQPLGIRPSPAKLWLSGRLQAP
ncbi:hypothetical protein, partial [Xanthomonas perforans]|uniref:hypothetical protein n=1 Tax=Xanthomonas perforans TaxID=442694 RepID=UPI001F1D1C72